MAFNYNQIRVGIAITSTLTGFLLPILLYILGNGMQESFSAYHNTDARLHLLSMMVLMSFAFFIGKHSYKVAGILLLLITFVTVDYPITHNILAGIFFAYTAILILIDKRFYFFAIPIIGMAFTVPMYGLYPFEIISVWCISSFNLLYILRFIRIINVR